MTIRKELWISTLLLAWTGTACMGDIVGSDKHDPTQPANTNQKNPPGTTVACADGVCVQASSLARLTRSQYENSVRQVLGDAIVIQSDQLPQNHLAASIFSTTESQPPSKDDVDRYSIVAEELAKSAELGPLLACDVVSGDASCASQFVDEVGQRLYRRPLTNEEHASYVDMFDWAVAEGDSFEEGIRLTLSTMLQSPHFLYLLEQAGDETPTALSGREVAIRLSYFLWREAPDSTLLEAAADGELDNADGVTKQARRMMDDPRFDRAIREFFGEWLGMGELDGLARDSDLYPDYSPALASAMREETERFAVNLFRNDDGRQPTLIAANYSLINPALAKLYGVSAASSSGFAKQTLPDRAGILTQASVLTVHATEGYTTPIFRGIFVRERLLCQDIPAPPNNVDELIEDLEKNLPKDQSERQHLLSLTGGAECASCHRAMNGVGLGFAHYDAIGAYRTVDSTGAPVDATAKLESPGPAFDTDVDDDYEDGVAMAQALSNSENVSRCLSTQWLRYALGREVAGDTTSIDDSLARFGEQDLDLKALIVAITSSDAFRHRVAKKAEN